jgi:hypothetical protein
VPYRTKTKDSAVHRAIYVNNEHMPGRGAFIYGPARPGPAPPRLSSRGVSTLLRVVSRNATHSQEPASLWALGSISMATIDALLTELTPSTPYRCKGTDPTPTVEPQVEAGPENFTHFFVGICCAVDLTCKRSVKQPYCVEFCLSAKEI